MASWQLFHEVIENLGDEWNVDASGPQEVGYYAGLASGPHGMRLFLRSEDNNFALDWLRVDGRFHFSDLDLTADLSLTLSGSLAGKQLADEIKTRLLPVYRDFLCAIENHDSTVRQLRYGEEYRGLFERGFGATVLESIGSTHSQLLIDGDNVAKFLEPIIVKFLSSFDLSSAIPSAKLHLQRTAERLVYYGLRTNCILFGSEYRSRHDDLMGLEELYETLLVRSLTASSQLRGYDKFNQRIPKWVFDTVFNSEVEPIQRELRIGWWKRMKNRNKFLNLFSSGVLLGMLYDMKSKELADQAST
jgi:hypothetical protein